MGRNVLVVSTVEHEEPTLRGAVGNADRVKVVVPVVKQGLLDWLTDSALAAGTISAKDLTLLTVTDDAAEAVRIIVDSDRGSDADAPEGTGTHAE